jgi:hypothetical protein
MIESAVDEVFPDQLFNPAAFTREVIGTGVLEGFGHDVPRIWFWIA